MLHRTPVKIRPTANAALAAQLDILGPADALDVTRDGQRLPDALNTETGNNTYPLKQISHLTRCTFTFWQSVPEVDRSSLERSDRRQLSLASSCR